MQPYRALAWVAADSIYPQLQLLAALGEMSWFLNDWVKV